MQATQARPVWDTTAYRPHIGQQPFHRSTARFRVICAGRRWGKDRACIYEILDLLPRLYVANEGKGLVPQVLVWEVAPTYPLTEQIWAEFKAFSPPGLFEAREGERMLRYLNGGAEVWMKTGAEPERLVGSGPDVIAITEAGLLVREAWETGLRPALSSPGRAGLALINGTPKGLNWFRDMYLRGQDPLDTEVESWNYPTSANPYIDPREIEQARRTLPDLVFRQEYLAEFLSDVGMAFRHVEGCIQGELEGPKSGHRYVFGIDLAKHKDFTVIMGADASTRRVVFFDRFSQIDWAVQRERIRKALTDYNGARAWIDSTGVGDPILEELTKAGLAVEGYHFTGASKRVLVDGLTVALEQEEIRYPKLEQLVSELKAFEYDMTRAGNLRTGAAAGYYDDCVIALALCNYGLRQSGGGGGHIKYAVGVR